MLEVLWDAQRLMKAELMQVALTGCCYRCGARRFHEVCQEFPLPPGWFHDALERLQVHGWVFASGIVEPPRAYCKHCWEATEG